MDNTVMVFFKGLGLEFDISSVAFEIGSFQVYWYGVLIASGLLLAMVYALRKAKDFGIDSDRMTDCVIVGIIGAVVGARLYYVLFNLDEYQTFADMLDIHKGGLAIYGGIIGGLLFGGITCRIRKVRLAPMFDLASIGFLIGQAIGRWGNFFNQEAFGTNTDLPWGMYSAETNAYLSAHKTELLRVGIEVDPSSPVHPCFLYESILCVLGLVLLLYLKKRRKFDGQLFCTYLAWYGVSRFFIEGLRTDSLMFGNVRVSQLLSAVVAVAAVAVLIYKLVFGKKKPLYVDTEESKLLLEKKNREDTEEITEPESGEEPQNDVLPETDTAEEETGEESETEE